MKMKDLLDLLAEKGVKGKKLERALEQKKSGRIPVRLTRDHIKRIEKLLTETGKCAMWRASTGKVLFITPENIEKGWKFTKRGGEGESRRKSYEAAKEKLAQSRAQKLADMKVARPLAMSSAVLIQS